MFRAEPEGKWIREDSFPNVQAHLIRKWQILIAGTGTLAPTELYGRSILADDRLVGKYLGPDGLALTFEEPGSDLNLYTYAFLLTDFGLAAIRSLSAGTKLLRPRLDMLAELRIPMADTEIIGRVAASVRQCVQLRERYLGHLASARRLIEAFPEVQEAHAMCSERRRYAVLWDGELGSLRAWNYASTGGAAEYLNRAWAARIGDIVNENDIFRGNRYNRIDCVPPHGIEMLSQRDAFLIRPIPRRIVRPDAPDRDLFVRPGSIVVAGAGTLGEGEIFCRAMYVSQLFLGRACTELLLRLQAIEGLSEALYAYLTTPVGFRLLRSTIFGTKLAYLHPDLVRGLPFPALSTDQLREVKMHVQAAFAAKDKGLEAERAAVRMVETEVLPAWLA
jgi:hypothetical protein